MRGTQDPVPKGYVGSNPIPCTKSNPAHRTFCWTGLEINAAKLLSFLQQQLYLKGSNVRRKGLPPGQKEVKGVPLRHIGAIPRFDPNTWRLEVYGEVEKPITFSLEDLKAEPSIVIVSDFHCVEGWSVLDNKLEGIPFIRIVEIVKAKESVKYVTFECDDGYTTSLPLSDLLEDKVLLAYKLDGKPLPLERGGPLRLIVPQKYAYKSPMWLRKIKFTSTQELGYWESRGYSNTADSWKEERYAKQTRSRHPLLFIGWKFGSPHY